jgi:cell wall-associated NlpC family hydrolase
MRSRLVASTVAAALALAPAASPSGVNWASAEIARVTSVGVLGSPGVDFQPQAPLTQQALANAVAATDKLLHPPPPQPQPQPQPTPAPPPPPTPTPPPVSILSSIPDGATIGGTLTWQVAVTGTDVQQVAFAVDGKQLAVVAQAPFELPGGLVTTSLADGTHQLATAAIRPDGGTYVAVWQVTTANAPGAALAPLPTTPVPVPITKTPPPPPPPPAQPAATPAPPPAVPTTPTPASVPTHLYTALAPATPVTLDGLDAALVEYLGLRAAADEFEQKLRSAGLHPRSDAGTEIVARLLGLRYTHPSNQVNLALLPFQSATRAEAAYSFARLLALDGGSAAWVQSLADSFTLPTLTSWQRRILTTAVSYIGYPYVWGGSSPTTEAPFGVQAPGGFDCSGFAWRVFKLTTYPGEGTLASILRGRTTYVMSGEVPAALRIPASALQPADALFFGVGVRSKSTQIDHMAIYLGGGWLIQSSGQGVTIAPFAGYYASSFAWARRPLHEAGLS